MTKLALIRHGHTDWNRAGRIQGRTDIPLDAEAETHLARLRLPAPWNAADIVASPLARAVRTGELISGRSPARISALTEMDWGAWEGEKGAELVQQPDSGFRHIEDWGWNWSPPQGETPAQVRGRVLPWALELKRDTVAVCHIGIMRVLLAIATGWNFDGAAPFRIKRDRLYVLSIDDGQLQVIGDPIRLEIRE